MSGYSLQACDEDYLKNMNPVRPNKSIWMDRWMTTSSKYFDVDQGEMAGHFAEPCNQKRLDINTAPCDISEDRNMWSYQGDDIAVASNVPHSTTGVEVLAEAKRVEITCETLAMNSNNLRGSILESEPVSVFKFSEKIGRILAQKRLAVSVEHESVTQTDVMSKHSKIIEPSNFNFLSDALRSTPTETAFQLRECHSLPGRRSKYREQLVKPFLSLEKVGLSGSKIFQDKFAGSSSNSLPYVLKAREVQSSMCRKEETDQSSFQVASVEHINHGSTTHAEHENRNHCHGSSVLVCHKEIDNYRLGSMNHNWSSYSWKKRGGLQLNDLSSSNFSFSASHGKPHKRKDDVTSTEHVPSQSCPGKLKRLQELYWGCHSSSDVLQPVHQIDELRAFTTLDSVGGMLIKGPQVSQTTNHRAIQDMSNGDPKLHYSNESASQKRFTLLPDFECHKECSEQLQPLGSPRNSEKMIGDKDECPTSASKNESSAETDTMDINVCRTWNSFPSITSSASRKDTMVVENSAKSHSTILRATLARRTEAGLPDINREPPFSLSAEKENVDISTSRTESLDVEHLHFDQAGNSSFSRQCLTQSSDPSSRWVKRLKLSLPAYHAHGTKNVKLEDSSLTAKNDKLCNKISDRHRTNLTTTFDKPRGEEADTVKENEPASVPSLKDSGEINPSHPWIQRWCHNQVPRPPMSTGAPVTAEVDCSNTASDDDQIKEFPSIAAMALMGKAMNGLQACKFQNEGSFIVWGEKRIPKQL